MLAACLQATQLIWAVYICSTETPPPKPGLTSHHKCLSMLPTCTLSSTSVTSPGESLHYIPIVYVGFTVQYAVWYSETLHCLPLDRYWLWYTTQRCVSGAVRKIYQKLKLFKVQFLSLQRKTDPSQVLLQCLPANKVWVLRYRQFVFTKHKYKTAKLIHLQSEHIYKHIW